MGEEVGGAEGDDGGPPLGHDGGRRRWHRADAGRGDSPRGSGINPREAGVLWFG